MNVNDRILVENHNKKEFIQYLIASTLLGLFF